MIGGDALASAAVAAFGDEGAPQVAKPAWVPAGSGAKRRPRLDWLIDEDFRAPWVKAEELPKEIRRTTARITKIARARDPDAESDLREIVDDYHGRLTSERALRTYLGELRALLKRMADERNDDEDDVELLLMGL